MARHQHKNGNVFRFYEMLLFRRNFLQDLLAFFAAPWYDILARETSADVKKHQDRPVTFRPVVRLMGESVISIIVMLSQAASI